MALIGWNAVQIGDVVLGADCMRWRVGYLDPATHTVGMERLEDGVRWMGTPTFSQVERVLTAAEVAQQEAEQAQVAAAALTQAGLVQDMRAVIEGQWPPLPAVAKMPDPGVQRAHMWIFHGDPGSQVPDSGLPAHHDTLHANPQMPVPHHHLS